MDFGTVLEAMRPDLKRVEDRLLEETALEYPLVGDILRGLIGAGGKRLRPLLVLLAARAFNYDLDRLVPAAAGIELLHTASLIHDDSIDHAELRRGQPTLNSVLPPEVVIMVGDYMFARSAMLAASTMNPRVLAVFANCLGSICDGQLREIFAARRADVSLDDYQRRIYGKTAALFAGSAEIGAILGDATDKEIDALRRYGGHLGMAFQIVDDVLDLRESTDHIGKPAGHDLRQGTVTLPTMLFLQNRLGDASSLALVEHVLTESAPGDHEVAAAVLAIRRSGAIEQAIELAWQYVEQAREALEAIPEGETRDMLAALAEHAVERHY
ncbi:polyprenyl synthetase family protein [Thermomicrobiaceae bacterium CFH 74404]|uniref:Polyprenyl synthetase family protein n=1 Tax=Thermalbibacter longus TaxID=2951981 RepID=A0AA42BAY1_9BACT|nr:polyprenyl synthetase family protein [Thermalbibacter longus]MCM8749189.1 polyprenyl synthetase family protein [Thermalbibacter longus]